MTIRKAREGDMPAVLGLMKQLIELHARLDFRYKRFREYRGLKSYIAEAASSRKKLLIIAEEKNRLLGYILCEIEAAPYYFRQKRVVKIADATVHEDLRRKGILRALFKFALEWTKKLGFREIELSVDARNRGATAAWKALGFKTYKLRMRRALKD